jgi:hypothetical protein
VIIFVIITVTRTRSISRTGVNGSPGVTPVAAVSNRDGRHDRDSTFFEHKQVSQYYLQRRGRSVKTIKATTLTDTESLAVLDVHCCIEREHDRRTARGPWPPTTASKTGTSNTRALH